MSPQEYIDAAKNKFGEQSTKDGQLVRDMNDFELLDRLMKKYPGDREKMDSVQLGEYYQTYDPSKKPPEPPPKTGLQKKLDQLTGGIAERFKERQNKSMDIEMSDMGLPSQILQQVGQGAGLALDIGGEGLKFAGNLVEAGGETLTEKIGRRGEEIISSAPAQAILGSEPVQGAVGAYEGLPEETKGNIEAVGNIAEFIPAGAIAGKAAKEGAEAVVDTAQTGARVARETVENAFTPTEAVVDKYIADSFSKAVKPSVAGKNTLGQSDRYQGQALDAVKTIADNKDNLKFVTPDGDEIVGLPTNLRQFAESIDQTKKSIYEQYSSLAKAAGDAGAEIDLANVASELDAVIDNKALQISNPEAIAYAKSIKDRLTTGGKIDATTAEQLIKNYNSSLESFYRNPSYETASRAAIDAAVVNNIRKDLDSVIEGLTGEKYQALKNQYASLKAIEKDVVKRANMDARKNALGLLDYTDIFSGGDIVGGILSLNPALFAKGVAQKGIKEWVKMLNDPNRAIKKMFEKTQVETR